jgi:hypothetical protein
MALTRATSPVAEFLVVAFAFGAPGGGVLILAFWWLLTTVADPSMANAWWEYALVAAYLMAPLWAPLLAGFATLRLAARLGWTD